MSDICLNLITLQLPYTYTYTRIHRNECGVVCPQRVFGISLPYHQSFNSDYLPSSFNRASVFPSSSHLMTGRIQGYRVPSHSTSLKHLSVGEVVNTLSCLYDFTQYQTVTINLIMKQNIYYNRYYNLDRQPLHSRQLVVYPCSYCQLLRFQETDFNDCFQQSQTMMPLHPMCRESSHLQNPSFTQRHLRQINPGQRNHKAF